jgi:rhodanese-related sulfurtransferase
MKIILLGVALAGIAACGGPQPGDGRTSLVDVAQAAARGSDSVAVDELARWIVEGREDFVLVDVRTAGDFKQGSIGKARNLSIAELVTEDVLDTLPADRKVIVYSNGSENGAKASVLLRLAGLDAHVLSGGYNAWHAQILNPEIPAEEQPGESLQVTEQRALACYFVGDRSGKDGAERPDVEFVPPVYTEPDQEGKRPPPVAEESC